MFSGGCDGQDDGMDVADGGGMRRGVGEEAGGFGSVGGSGAAAAGAEINVTSGRRVAPDLCLVSTVDENALTCVDENSNVRMIFPRNAVQNVWVFEKAPNRHVGLWIAVAISAGLEIASCVFEGPGGCAFTGFMFFLAWVSAADAPPYPIWLPNSPRPERWRRRLVYQMPVSAVAP
jgi:hypothetical protein